MDLNIANAFPGLKADPTGEGTFLKTDLRLHWAIYYQEPCRNFDA